MRHRNQELADRLQQQMRESIEPLSRWERTGEGCWRPASITIRKNLEVLGYGE